jgi:hypothetical protein
MFDGEAGTFSFTFETRVGVNYLVEYKNNIDDATWTTLQTVVGDGTVVTITDPGPLPDKRFYRIVIQ